MENSENGLHIGHLIQEQLRKDNRSVGWLARQIPCSRNHVYKIFNKPSLDSDLILKISNAMNFNFFQYYTAEFKQSLAMRIGEECFFSNRSAPNCFFCIFAATTNKSKQNGTHQFAKRETNAK